ncbi:MAG: cyclic nucleotide-binding domain-containing protein [Candidatus Theseobacter exili]|nr:cyclic nucleotide-binding domain-containing protein [Candidatus Theseobacter exili]
MKVNQILPLLAKISIFGGIEPEQLSKILDISNTEEFGTGDYIFKAGEPATDIFVVLSGEIQIVLKSETEHYKLTEFTVGDCFGETSAIGILNHSASAVAISPVKLLLISRNILMNLYHDDSKLFGHIILNIARETCRRLYQTDKTLLHYAEHPPNDER